MPGTLDVGGDTGGLLFLVGIVVVATLVTLPFVGRFFAGALAGGILVAGLLVYCHGRWQR